jgi:ubiquinone/menaquinone biosynthesis C-methylase UbiE
MDEKERIVAEVARRAAQIPEGFYALDRPANRFIYRRYTTEARALIDRAGLRPMRDLRVLEIGCGHGQWLVEFRSWGVSPRSLCGIDLDSPHILEARTRLSEADLRVGDAACLPWSDGEFDVVIQSTVFTSILDPGMRSAVAREMVRVLRSPGVILWYDFVYDNPRNPHVRGIGLREMRRLFPGFAPRYRRVTLAPPLARRVVPFSETLAKMLYSMPFLRTHIVATLQRSGAAIPNAHADRRR